MDTYEVELELVDPNGFAATIPALPGLLVLGTSLDDVLEHARASIAWHVLARASSAAGVDIAVRDGSSCATGGAPSQSSREPHTTSTLDEILGLPHSGSAPE